MTRGMISALATTGTELYGVPGEVDAGRKASRQASREAAAANKPRGGHDPSDRTGMCVRDGSQILPVRIARFLSPPQAPKNLGGFAIF